MHTHIYLLLLLSSFTSLGTGRRTQEAEPVRGAYLQTARAQNIYI